MGPALVASLAGMSSERMTIGTGASGGASAPTLGAESSASGSFPPSPGIERGTAIGRYVVIGRIGAGGMGVVYAAYDPELDRKIAIKVLRGRGHESESARARTRLLREAQALARLSHPNVISVHDVGTFEDRVFVAMEFIEGQTLRAWAKTPRSLRDTLAVLVEAGRGLSAAHAAGLVHRDVKPDNVMIDEGPHGRGRVRVMDFGLVRELFDPSSAQELDLAPTDRNSPRDAMTRDGSMLGTPGYIAPELLGGGQADAAADQFAFAVTAWEVIFGAPPFGGETIHEVNAAVLGGRLERRATSAVPTWLPRVLGRALAPRPADRFPDLEALLRELGRDRSVARRRGIAAFAAVAVGAGAWGWQVLDRRATIEACEREADAIAQTWNPGRRASIGAALRATQVSYAHGVDERLGPVLDDLAATWGDAARESCLSTRVEHERPPELEALGQACLQDVVVDLEGLLGTLEQPDAETVQHAIASALQLPRPRDCLDERLLRQRPRLPDDPATRARMHDLERRLAHARALERTGHSEEAMRRAADLRAEAEPLGFPPLSARAALAEGRSAERTGDFARARAALRDAFFTAAGTADDDIAIDAASHLAFTLAMGQGELDLAEEWLGHMRMLLRRSGLDESGLHVARFDQLEAQIADRRGDHEIARAANERALAGYERELGPDHVVAANPLGGLARAALLQGDFEAALAYHQRALALRTAALGPDHPEVASTHSNIGNLYGTFGRYAEALEHHRRGLSLLEAARGPDHVGVAVSRVNYANDLVELGRHAEAIPELRRALAAFERAPGGAPANAALALFNLGIALRKEGELDEAATSVERARALWEKTLGAEHPNVALTHMMHGEIELARGRPDLAIDPLARAVEMLEQRPMEPRDLATARFTLGRALWEVGDDRPRALTLVDAALEQVRDRDEAADLRADIERWQSDRGKAKRGARAGR